MSRFRFLISPLAGVICACIASGVAADVIDGEELIDPTRPLLVEQEAVPEEESGGSLLDMFRAATATEFEVTFVRASSRSPMAIVNDQRVTVGDVISGATVVAIDRNSVTMEVDGLQQEISLYTTNVKSPVN